MQNLVIKSRNPTIPDRSGDDFFMVFVNSFLNDLSLQETPPIPHEDGAIPTKSETLLNKIEDSYNRLCKYHRINFEEKFYFEYFIFLLNFINQNEFVHDSDLVMDTFISNLTFNETICMACYAVLRNQELKNYIQRYGLLRNLDNHLLDINQIESLKFLYSNEAFISPTKVTLDFLFESTN